MQNVYMQKNKNFNTIIIKILFPFSYEKKEVLKKTILPAMLVYTNQKWKEEEDFRKEISKRSILSLKSGMIEIGKQCFLSFTCVMPDKKTVEEDLLPNALSFLLDTIYHPNIINGAFEEKLFLKEKRSLEKDIENVFHNITSYSQYKIWSFLDPKEEYIVSAVNHKEELATLTAQEVYAFYKKIVPNKKPIIFIYGDFKKKNAEEIIQKYLEKEKVTFPKDFHPIYKSLYTKNIKKPIKIEETKPFHQSYLTYVYQIENIKIEEEALLISVSALLSSSSTNLLMKKLRDELGLVYSTFSKVAGDGSLLFVTAKLYKENRKKAEKGLEEVMEILKDKTKVAPLLDLLKEDIKVYKVERKDAKFALLDSYMSKTLQSGKTTEEIFEDILSIKVEDITNFVARLKKILTYFLKGEENE